MFAIRDLCEREHRELGNLAQIGHMKIAEVLFCCFIIILETKSSTKVAMIRILLSSLMAEKLEGRLVHPNEVFSVGTIAIVFPVEAPSCELLLLFPCLGRSDDAA
eukprot:GEZU01012407.1.p2 GENE.GEZU01012407.1~~GEZU01012407.1.p2  ORF type:complete len:105 (+),score=0.82 GEZU01012407.1:285-599(+)